MRISDWSSDVCSSDLLLGIRGRVGGRAALRLQTGKDSPGIAVGACGSGNLIVELGQLPRERLDSDSQTVSIDVFQGRDKPIQRSEERCEGEQGVMQCRYRWCTAH